jgi:site-specific DNA-methyltransferase (adenine-specific)
MPDCSVDAVVTDPPYGLAFMGKRWDYDVPSVEIWAECLRVLKPGGHLLAFAGTRTQHRMAVRIEDAGFEIRDMIAWVYGSGFPKSHNLKDDWQGWGTALKPALEPITMARKPLVGTVAANVLAHGTGGINVDGCRIDAEPRSFSGTPNRHGGQLAGGGEKGEMRPDWTETRGRWPANLITDGSDEVVGLFPQTTSTGGSGPASRGYSSDGRTVSGSCAATGGFGDTGSAARFFYTAKASKADRDEGCEELEAGTAQGMRSNAGPALVGEDRNRTQARNTHPTVKPTDLMRYLCRLVTPPGGIVLDPFMGSGSTGKAAMLEGFGFIGIEREAAYHAIAERRVRQAAAAGHQSSLLLA